MANALQRIRIGDEPDAWRTAGFSVLGNRVVFGKVVIELAGADGQRGVHGWTIDGVDVDIDTIPTLMRPAVELVDTVSPNTASPNTEPEANTNAVFGIDHVVIETADVDRTVACFAEVGMAERRSGTMSTPMGERRQSFLWAGRVVIEIVGPLVSNPDGDAGASIWGLALVSSNLQTTTHVLDDMISEPRDAVQPGRKIATVRTKELDISVPLVIMSPHVAELL